MSQLSLEDELFTEGLKIVSELGAGNYQIRGATAAILYLSKKRNEAEKIRTGSIEVVTTKDLLPISKKHKDKNARASIRGIEAKIIISGKENEKFEVRIREGEISNTNAVYFGELGKSLYLQNPEELIASEAEQIMKAIKNKIILTDPILKAWYSLLTGKVEKET